jgi:hypothetical protein
MDLGELGMDTHDFPIGIESTTENYNPAWPLPCCWDEHTTVAARPELEIRKRGDHHPGIPYGQTRMRGSRPRDQSRLSSACPPTSIPVSTLLAHNLKIHGFP